MRSGKKSFQLVAITWMTVNIYTKGLFNKRILENDIKTRLQGLNECVGCVYMTLNKSTV